MAVFSIARLGLSVTLIALASFYSYGQDASSVKIKFPRHTIRLDSAMRMVRQQLGVEFTYNPQQINVKKKIAFKNTRPTLTEFLETLNRSGFATRVMDNHIVLTNAPKPRQPVQPEQKIIAAKPEEKAPEITVAETADPQEEAIATTLMPEHTETVEKESVQQLFNDPAQSVQQPSVTKETPVVQKRTPAQKTRAPKKSDSDLFTPFIKAGVTVNEVFYSGAHVSTGVPMLFAEVSLATNYDVNQFRYGIGTSVNLGSRVRLITSFSTGKGSRMFTIRDSLESSSMRVTEKLDKVTAGIEWKLRKNLVLDAGLSWNKLSSTYDLMDTSNLPADYNKNFNNEFYVIKPPYTLSNEHTSKSGIKTWVGFYIGVSYRFNFPRKR